MATPKTFMEESTAPGTGAGFDYQFHYFVYRLLNMKKGQSLGLEIKDDVHSDLDNDVQLLFQLKHTIQTQAGGSPIALRKLRTSCPSAGNGRLGDAEKTDFQPQIIGKPRHSLGFLPSRAHLSCRRQ